MSTTVIASRHGAALHLLPAASRELDVPAVRQVLVRHGLNLVESPSLRSANEFIAAQGLDPSEAALLSADLQAIGLTVRVVNRTALTTSSWSAWVRS